MACSTVDPTAGHGVQRRAAYPGTATNASPARMTMRAGRSTQPSGPTDVIVLEQFEQVLHAKKKEENTELVQALRQCNGSRVQCIVMVRDDFWMAVTRFLRALEVRLVEAPRQLHRFT